ncbi:MULTISPECIES: hypothetical protein [Sinorhizobium]|uniref:hypothetical protein n=1 Tax=Sinorhizobium TaxID=28105 RepID=UPI0011A0E291|nr:MULTISPECIES: hypothetical protein [Sinorhizobium]MDW9484073.1 hypothetical protein [Sinorhizobium meliloti]MDX0523526.1 hypothetical protein [Sinorhizobium medicae]MDX0634249.1 hypothetical protein [Sinorhizobium medicae]MQV61389.1 hypothetical protein [Sinorhizobium meliloti]TWA50544.1 hypothetical protein FB008_11255 [Sinorhizobium medicae]
MSTFTLSPQLSASAELKLSNSRSAGLFVEAMQLIRRYEETSSRDLLESAAAVLKKCIAAGPQDALPRFYFGITQSALGDLNQEVAIPVFKEFSRSKEFPLRAAATYNLAAAYVETYDPELFREGIRLLDDLLKELREKGVPLGQSERVRGLRERFAGDRRIRVEQLYYQSEETRDYFHIHLHVWKPRWDYRIEQIETAAYHALQKLAARRGRIKKHERFLGRQRAEIWAWHWNNVGSVYEVLAALAKRTGNRRAAMSQAELAEDAFRRARDEDPSFGSSLPNLGRMKFEILGDVDGAIEIFEKVAAGVEDTTYADFCLGQLYSVKREPMLALEHFLKAPDLIRPEKITPDWVGARLFIAKELKRWHQRDAALSLFTELANEFPADEELRHEVEDLRSPGT